MESIATVLNDRYYLQHHEHDKYILKTWQVSQHMHEYLDMAVTTQC